MKKLILIFGIATLVGCNQPQERKSEPITETQIVPEPVQKKSSANFIVVSEVHEPMGKSPGNPSPGHKNLYSIYVENFKDKDKNVWDDMSAEAKSKPHDTNGFTVVFFFSNKANTPSLNNRLEWAEKYDKYCVGGYWYYPNGSQEMKRYPMK